MKHKEENNECISLKEMSEEYGISLNTLWGATKYLVANNLIIKKAKKNLKLMMKFNMQNMVKNIFQLIMMLNGIYYLLGILLHYEFPKNVS
ncbi:hypothetical protein ACM0IS_03890 [Mycoplasma aquilae ATCC BAA-1896]|uniref:hypothetical protein n=1 Tax=Mycoplasma aquilae TaxID=1312741 RepID=UPI003A8AEA8E